MQAAPIMRVKSVNVGLPREIIWKKRRVVTAIFKEPVSGPVEVRQLNLTGDRQADLSVHGGPDKALYAYPAEHYPYWRETYPDMELPWAMFGENLTTEGFLEDTVFIGDRFRIGTAEVVVTQPRMPCYKLGLRLGRDDVLKRMLKSGFTGFYFAVLKEGEVAAGDAITLIQRDAAQIKVSDITRLYTYDRNNLELLARATALDALPASWRDYFRKHMTRLAG